MFLDVLKEGKLQNDNYSQKNQSIHENSKRLSLISEKTEDGAESPNAKAQFNSFQNTSNDSNEESAVSSMQIVDEVIDDLDVFFPTLGFEVIEETETDLVLRKRSNSSQFKISKTIFSNFNRVDPDTDRDSENDYSIIVKDDNKNTTDVISPSFKNVSLPPKMHISLKSEGRFSKLNV